MEEVGLKQSDRKVVEPAREYSSKLKEMSTNNDICPVVAIELNDGTILTGRNSEVMSGTAAVVLNAIKHYANLADNMHLISPVILNPIIDLKGKTLKNNNTALNCEEILMALSICAATNPTAQLAMEQLSKLKGAQAHSTTIISGSDEQTFRKLGIDVTCDPEYPSERLFEAN